MNEETQIFSKWQGDPTWECTAFCKVPFYFNTIIYWSILLIQIRIGLKSGYIFLPGIVYFYWGLDFQCYWFLFTHIKEALKLFSPFLLIASYPIHSDLAYLILNIVDVSEGVGGAQLLEQDRTRGRYNTYIQYIQHMKIYTWDRQLY